MSDTLVVGLTGGIASGKTTVANYLSKQGAYLIDTDIIAREVVAPNSPTTLAISGLLGEDYLLDGGNLNRQKIKKRIFNDALIMSQYESIILPAIRKATLESLNTIPSDACYALLIVPLLFEKGLDRYCDYTVSVDLSMDEQVRRGVERKPNDEPLIRKIIASQMSREARNARADFIVDNNQSLENLYPQLNKLHQQLLELAHPNNA